MVTKENVFNSKGWNLINKVSSIFSMHHIYRQNYSNLEQLLVKIHNDIFITTDVNQAIFVHLEQYIFNFLASASALTDLSRKTMNYYKGTDLYEKYQIMVKEAFDNDLSQFVRNLRNYQTHYQLVFPYTVKSLDDNKLWDVVLISKDLLKYPDQWNARAKKFINKNGEEVNVNKVFAEYNCLVDAFYMWLYAKLDEYHITFQKILDDTYKNLENHKLSDFYNHDTKPYKCDEVNYKIIANKDGLYAWRPFQLIHPALYVELVKQITEKDNWNMICLRFKEFQKNNKIQCASIPIVSTNPKKTQKSEQISTWWKEIEQGSIKQAIEFSYIYVTDITDCYGSIYTHTICWALHGKEFAKKYENRDNPKLIGCLIDMKLKDMSFGQTNGIPQGSVLMDFIAEIVLGYADLLLSQKLEEKNIKDYHIIRYRDDYRIFVNNPTEGDAITKYLTEILIELGLKLNPTKTSSSKNIILGSIKKDKLDLTTSQLGEKYLSNDNENVKYNNQRLLLQIYDFADKHPNSGQLKRILTKFYEKMKLDCKKDDMGVLLSIVADLAYNNPSTYNLCAAIISKIIECIQSKEEKINYINKIIKKFKSLPNTGFMDIWLQRISYKISSDIQYEDKLCKLMNHQKALLWNSDWLTGKLKQITDKCQIINENIIEHMLPVITQKEVDAFQPQYDEFDWDDV